MRQRNWIHCLLNLGLCSVIIAGKDSMAFEKAEMSVGGVQQRVNVPNPGTVDDNNNGVFDEMTPWKSPSGFSSSSSQSSGKELESNENLDLSTVVSSTAASTTAAQGQSTAEVLIGNREKTTTLAESAMPEQVGRKWPKKVEQEEKTLLTFLMDGYEKDVRPVRNASQPILIEVGITLTQIFDMDEKNQVLTTTVWLDQVSRFSPVNLI